MDFLTIKDLSAKFKVSRQTLTHWIRDKKIPYGIKINRRRYWQVEQFRKFLEEKENECS